MHERVIGGMGGMGPEATVELMRRVIAAAPAEDDADHIRMIVPRRRSKSRCSTSWPSIACRSRRAEPSTVAPGGRGALRTLMGAPSFAPAAVT